jgi:cobalt-zinc-cadmium efflux system membrane fusion protein
MEQAPHVKSFQSRAVFLVFVGCSAAAEPQTTFSPPPAITETDNAITVDAASRPYVATKAVAREESAPVVRAPARLAFRDGAVSQINLPLSGRVTEVKVATGDRVKAGDPLLVLSSPEAAGARAALAAALAEHDAAKKELARQEQMATSGVGVESERVGAQAKLRQVEAELARAQTTVALFGGGGGSTIVVRAPIEGIVISRRATVGTVAEPGGEPLIEIGNPSALWVIADVFERDLVQVREGAEVDVEVATGTLHGKVATIGSALTGSMRTAPVYVALDATPVGLRAGMFARATIKAPAGESIVLPAEAVLIKGGKRTVVYVKQAGDRYVPRDVTVARSVDGKVEVMSGLQPGEQVIVKGALLIDGAAEQLM